MCISLIALPHARTWWLLASSGSSVVALVAVGSSWLWGGGGLLRLCGFPAALPQIENRVGLSRLLSRVRQ